LPSSRLSDVEALEWLDFRQYMADNWKQGEHVALVAPTGQGKSTFAGGILQLRRWCLALDPKGGDDTIDAYGWPRLTKWPLSLKDRHDMRQGEPVRYVVGGRGRSPEQRATRRNLQVRVLQGVLKDGGWTIYCDDLQTLSDARFGAAADQIEELLILARGAKVSVVSAFQRPARVPRAAGDQATYFAVAYTRDVDVVNRIAEMMGRSAAEMRGAISALGDFKFGWLVVSRNPRDPLILTRPQKLQARTA
jgi:hypothetical protein